MIKIFKKSKEMMGFICSLLLTLFIVHTVSSSFVIAQGKIASTKTKKATKPAITNKQITPPPATQVSTPPVSAVEQAILDEINAVRDNPQKYIEYLQVYRNLFEGNSVYGADQQIRQTIEGPAAVDECIEFLKTATKLPPYTLSKGLSQAANLQLKDIIADPSGANMGKDGSSLSDQLAKFGSVGNISAENLVFSSKTPRGIVLAMLISDGLKSRNQRKNLFSSTFKQVGLSFGNGGDGETLCVVVFADQFKDK